MVKLFFLTSFLGQLCDNTSNLRTSSVVAVQIGEEVVDFASANGATGFVTKTGKLYAW
jgi:hypothetical protein